MTDGKAESQYEANKLYYDQVVEEKTAKLDGVASEMTYHIADWDIFPLPVFPVLYRSLQKWQVMFSYRQCPLLVFS